MSFMNLISNMPASLFIPSVHISGIVLRVAGQIVASPPGEQFRRPDTTPQQPPSRIHGFPD
ncbi:hypothetical protein EcE24377A_F0033 (plasmid) [Escherichia coli O139:H28 str. E24377A]|uniref:Uncharacterized protein n=1 Tax=Escherichia coli O139:H28 (strain E24377A / ETEC) TaxID=331111 RepID=A7ZGN0_ECO24|nr:hypothetical protein EcE24377A_F0033 [Escherichia coli O139:H28 str. E24377A]